MDAAKPPDFVRSGNRDRGGQMIRRQGGRWFALALVAVAGIAGCNRSPEGKSAEYLKTGKRLMQNRDMPRAILQFRNAVQAMPRNPEAHYQLSLAYLAVANFNDGILELRKTLDLNPKHAGAQLKMAQLMVESGDEETFKRAQQR